MLLNQQKMLIICMKFFCKKKKTMLCSRPEPQKAALPAKLISYVYFTRKINEVKKKDADKITDVSLAMASESPQRSEETSVTENISQPTSDVNTKIHPTDSKRYLE